MSTEAVDLERAAHEVYEHRNSVLGVRRGMPIAKEWQVVASDIGCRRGVYECLLLQLLLRVAVGETRACRA
jgi:hypothetical protein